LDGEREVVLSLILAAGKTKVQKGKKGFSLCGLFFTEG
jgi:hypothetical protein